MKKMLKTILELLTALTAAAGVVIIFITAGADDARKGMTWLETTGRLLSYFTIESNLMVAALFAGRLIFRKGRAAGFFQNAAVNGGITLYITITGVVYFFMLRGTFQSISPLFGFGNELLHTWAPMLALIYWILYIRPQGLRPINALAWLAYPMMYLVYTLVRGALTQVYPYPFINVTALGYPRVLVTAFVMAAAFYLLGLVFVGLASIGIPRRQSQEQEV